MEFIRVDSPEEGVGRLRGELLESLRAGKGVTWFISGGSNVVIETKIMDQLWQEASEDTLTNLTVMLVDERYGAVGHADSNWQQLLDAGFNVSGTDPIPALCGLGFEDTVSRYSLEVGKTLTNSQVRIAQLGIGDDGHIAGILPHSLAVFSGEYVCGYNAGNFRRITLTPKALAKMTEHYIFAFGEKKRDAIQKLKSENRPVDDQPMQILKQFQNVYIYTNQL